MVAVPRTQMVISMRLTQERAHHLIAELEQTAWQRLSCGDGAHGPRLYDWASVDIRPLREPGAGHWLLARRSISNPGDLAYYICFADERTHMEELVRVAGSRWAVEECFQAAKNETGLDHYQVRGYRAWYRHITLCMAASVFLVRLQQVAKKGGPLYIGH
ncbi:hypothetical protein SAMN05216275_1251 [Streptosporangium canum]|uniref:Transposase DDE domain-containing protein n=1 Tax=Streptosporangium canum TaxID=324952 RepID=A0A1I3ZG85_9ACTN|nr:hypothetical protein SAMN05216275_1251 [Streptosporangium canum]